MAGKKENTKQEALHETARDERSLEEAFARLDELVEKLEDREIPLEESFRIYKEGVDLLRQCNEKIDRVEKSMQQLDEDGTLRDFS